jgi:hypothetical protein
MQEVKFETLYYQVVTEALSILGKRNSLVIISYIQSKYHICLRDTASNPKALSDALESILNGASKIIQRKIVRLLYNKIGIELPFVISIDFEETIFKAREELEKRNQLP